MDNEVRLTGMVQWYSQQLQQRDLALAQLTVDNAALRKQLDASISDTTQNGE
jgi:hypothetical protein